MKRTKILVFLLSGLILFGTTACSGNEDTKKEEEMNQGDNTVVEQTINLNDEVEVNVNRMGLNDSCGFFLFTTNLNEVFPDADIDEYNRVSYWVGDDTVEGEISKRQFDQNMDQLKFDVSLENNAKTLLEELQQKANQTPGVEEFTYHYDNHKFQYTYSYLEFTSEKYANDTKVIADQLQNAFSSAMQLTGTCGNGDYTTVLDEKLCTTYHLTCDRW